MLDSLNNVEIEVDLDLTVFEIYRFQGNYFWLATPPTNYMVNEHPSCVYTAKQILLKAQEFLNGKGQVYAIWHSFHVYIFFENQQDEDSPYNMPRYLKYEDIPLVGDLRKYVNNAIIIPENNIAESCDITKLLLTRDWAVI